MVAEVGGLIDSSRKSDLRMFDLDSTVEQREYNGYNGQKAIVLVNPAQKKDALTTFL